MGQRGIYRDSNGGWQVDKVFRGHRLRERFSSHSQAQEWLIGQTARLQTVLTHGERAERRFDEAATHYLLTYQHKPSIVTETHLLDNVMPDIGQLALHQVHDGTLSPFVQRRLREGRAHKTINLALGVVRRILNLAAKHWRDENGNTWLAHAPAITMLPLVGYQREPRPISWSEQGRLLPLLPDHLSRMALFVLNTGVRDDVVCSLRWSWEIEVPELGMSIFEVPREHVKGRRRPRVVVCNTVAQSLVEQARDQHKEFVFVYRRERIKNFDLKPLMPYRRIETMHNTAWQRARREAGLEDLHVHDLRHTVGMRLREAGVPESTAADILWHSTRSMTQHYSVAQIVELHTALEKIREDTGRWNKTLATLRKEQEERQRGAAGGTVLQSPPKVPKEKTNGLEAEASNPLI